MTVSPLMLGKGPARKLYGVADLDAYILGKPPTPPASFLAPRVNWGMLCNDRLGCCVISGAGHLIMAENADLAQQDAQPTDAQIEAQYFSITGGQDTGCVEADVLALWRSKGLFGDNKIGPYAPVTPSSVLAVHRAIAFYGAAFIGVQLPQSAMDQFNAGQPWTVEPGSPILGGHCILPVGYDASGIQCVTWGSIVTVTWPWWESYVDEVWCVISQEVIEAKQGTGPKLDLATLTADLDRLGA